MSALLDNGDEILIRHQTILCGPPVPHLPAKPFIISAMNSLTGIRTSKICAVKSPDRTKALVIINPNNPTGALYPKRFCELLISQGTSPDHFSDEIYDRLVMDGKNIFPLLHWHRICSASPFSGLSKSHMIAGFRIGWMVLSGNKAIAKDYIEGIKMLSNMRLCSNVPAQSVVQTALGGHQSVNDYIVPGGRIYENSANIFTKALTDIPGITAVKPQGCILYVPKDRCEEVQHCK